MKTLAQSTSKPNLGHPFPKHASANPMMFNIDEDEATLAVDAAHEALQMAQLGPNRVTRLVVVGERAADWGPVAQLALGLRHAKLDLSADGHRPGSTEGVVLTLHSTGLRANAVAPAGDVRTEATARLDADDRHAGDATGPATTIRHAPGRVVNPETLERLIRAEAKALASVPMGAHVPRGTWDAALEARYRLLASVCDHCKRGHHPPLNPCPMCGGHTRAESLWKPGRLHTWTIVAAGAGPSEFDPWQEVWGEYGVAVVEYEHGIRVAGMMADTDPKPLRAGALMEPIFRRLYAQEGVWRYGTKFRAVR